MSPLSLSLLSRIKGSESGAIFSPDRLHRFMLWRVFDEAKPHAVFIGLNPSTADEFVDDPTIRRCIDYARDWGFGSMFMVNIFAYRATNPQDMKRYPLPVGPGNSKWIREACADAGVVICCWGNHGAWNDRGAAVARMLQANGVRLNALRVSTTGQPCHPLYLKKALLYKPYEVTP